MLHPSYSRMRVWAGVAILAGCAVCSAQPAHRAASRTGQHKDKVQATKAAAHARVATGATTAAKAQSQKSLSLQDQPPRPATVTLAGGKLAVKADNSSLVQILDHLSKSGGMSISGLDQDQRVFGVYGPGSPSRILSELLEGAGYNVLMLGVTRDGTPRKLVLSERGNVQPSPPESFPQEANSPPFYQQPTYQRQPAQPPPPRGNLNFPARTPAQMYQQMMQQRQAQQPH